MITQLLTDSLNDLKTDTTTVAGLAFLAFLAIYFFVVMKPAIDSRRRINRQVQRRLENDRANVFYQQKIASTSQKGVKGGALENKEFFKNTNKPTAHNRNYYKKDKGYQVYLRQNSKPLQNKQTIKHERFKKVSASGSFKPKGVKGGALENRDFFRKTAATSNKGVKGGALENRDFFRK